MNSGSKNSLKKFLNIFERVDKMMSSLKILTFVEPKTSKTPSSPHVY